MLKNIVSCNDFKHKLLLCNKELIGDFNGTGFPITVKCLLCEGKISFKSARSAIRSKNCKKCFSKRIFRTKEEIKTIINDNGFKIVGEYTVLDNPLTIECFNCKNQLEFKQAKNALKKQKCKTCSSNGSSFYSLEEIRSICIKNNINFIDDKFISIKHYHNFQCNNGHNWKAQFREINKSFKKENTGCRECMVRKNTLSIEHIKNIYFDRKLKLLDDNFYGIKKKYNTQCINCNHIWKASASGIIHSNNSCPNCSHLINEAMTAKILESVIQDEIIHNYLLKRSIVVENKIIRNHLYIDFVFKTTAYNVYIEYNGAQHYRPVKFGSQNKQDIENKFYAQQIRDNWLRQYCQENKIILIEIDGRKYRGNKIKPYLLNKLKELQII